MGKRVAVPSGDHLRLIMVTDKLKMGNNKFYNMDRDGGDTWTATYGRVETTSVTRTYPASRWDSKYREKVRKGYRDVTELHLVEDEVRDFVTIGDNAINSIVAELQAYANHSVSRNYTVSASAVTPAQVDEAQSILDNLVPQIVKAADVKPVNDGLLELYHVIPRRMTNVKDHLIQDFAIIVKNDQLDKIHKLIAREQATLDVMAGQVNVHQAQKGQTVDDQTTILDAMGLAMVVADDAAVRLEIMPHLGSIGNKFKRAFTVINKRTQDKYDSHLKTVQSKAARLFWHGSRNENWWSILDSGLVLRPTNAVISGKMFGYGLYFADKAKKSLGYTSLRGSYWAGGSQDKGFMCLYEVHMGSSLIIQHHQSWCYDLTEQKLQQRGNYDSLSAMGGADLRNNEFIVYNEGQVNVKYLVEFQ